MAPEIPWEAGIACSVVPAEELQGGYDGYRGDGGYGVARARVQCVLETEQMEETNGTTKSG
jgi:hypothetical protein